MFGAKTDNGPRRQTGLKLLPNQQSSLCPVKWVRLLIQVTRDRRIKETNNHLFITIKGMAKPASRTLIGGGVRSVLKNAGIDASPGSCQSAVAFLAWLENRPIEEILERGNWKAVETLRKHYCRENETPFPYNLVLKIVISIIMRLWLISLQTNYSE